MAQLSKLWQERQTRREVLRVADVVQSAVTKFSKEERDREPYYNLNRLAGCRSNSAEIVELRRKLAEVSNEP